MTEFTKQELEITLKTISDFMHNKSNNPSILFDVTDKLKKMIEEYPAEKYSSFEVLGGVSHKLDSLALIDILFEHKNRQIDENRAVHKSLNEIRERLEKLEEPNDEKSAPPVPLCIVDHWIQEVAIENILKRLDKLENPELLCVCCKELMARIKIAGCDHCGVLGVVS